MLFLAILVISGLNQRESCLSDLWSDNPILGNSKVKSIMSYPRFSQILRFLHISDSTKAPAKDSAKYDRLYKLRPVIDLLNSLFQAAYSLPQKLSVDEMMIAFKGRNTMKQYIQNKPVKRGFKIWALCSYFGYVWRFEIYTGGEGSQDLPLGYRVVLNLVKGLSHLGHVIYCDRFFSSVMLAEELLQQGVFLTGTVKKNSKFFPALSSVSTRGAYQWKMQENGVLAGVWKDNKEVYFISTASPPTKDPMPTCKRRIQNKLEQLPIPPAIQDYNQAKSGVDIADQRRSYWEIKFRQLRRWWIPIFFFMVDTIIENARFLVNLGKSEKDTINSKDFRLALVDLLVPESRVECLDATKGHFPSLITDGHNRRCQYCKEVLNRESRTRYECRICDVGLCICCFGTFHLK